ncbi:hypothetical protein ACJIZ3_022396 [Penstemon smallii]|uniref:Phospholipase/carboxylesterase/thioesterase domain-containing protein n=1 Tax=Penstemon smallii TaxID=265156 RepID=A0ABD3TN83_9LAMI
MASGSTTSGSTCEFGRIDVVRPKGKHEATIVWLHGLGNDGSSYQNIFLHPSLFKFSNFNMQIKWICPTAPTRPVAIVGGFNCTAWFDVGELTEDGPDDFEGLDASAAHVANLLTIEPADVKLGIGGFGFGAALALYSATCFARGQYENGNAYPVNLSAIFGLRAWLPGSSYVRSKIEGSQEARRRASSLPMLLSHGKYNEKVPYEVAEQAYHQLVQAGFRRVLFKTNEEFSHNHILEEMDDVCNWLKTQGF